MDQNHDNDGATPISAKYPPGRSIASALLVTLAVFIVLAPGALTAGEKGQGNGRDPNPLYNCLDLAECLDGFRDREFFESIYRYAYIDRTARHKFTLGLLYEHGLGVPADLARAARWYREAAAAEYEFPYLGKEAAASLARLAGEGVDGFGDPIPREPSTPQEIAALNGGGAARTQLATQYFYGLCAPMDYELSRDWEIRAAESGDLEAVEVVAYSFAAGEYAYPRDAAQAAKWRAILGRGDGSSTPGEADGGGTFDPASVDWRGTSRSLAEHARQFYLEGKRYYEGDGVPVDYFMAGLRFMEAAGFDTGEPENYFLLGRIQEMGLCGEENPYGAGKQYRIAAELGHPDAMLRLAALHEEGRGVRRSRAEAEKWYAQAAAAGVAGADTRLRSLRERTRPEEKEDWETSPAFRDMLALAQFRAYFRHSPFRLPDEMRKATAMLMRAVDSGLPMAEYLAGLVYLRGDAAAGVAADRGKGLALLERAAEAGVAEAAEEMRRVREESDSGAK